jgi:hypothetical protein
MQLFCGFIISSDAAVQRFTSKQSVGTIFTFDAYQAGFQITSSPATCRTTFPMSGTIDLSNGSDPYTPQSLILGQDLILNDVTTISSLGNITGAGYALVLPKSVSQFPVNTSATNCTFSNLAIVCNGDFIWQAPSVTFSGNSIINGQGNVITLAAGTSITVASGATLVLQDVTIKNLINQISSASDNTGTIVLKNATLVLGGEYRFDYGTLSIAQDARIAGSGSFLFKSAVVGTVASGATLTIDPGVVFIYGSTTNNKFQLADSTAQLFLNSATLQVAAGATAGLSLTEGTILVDGLSYLDDPSNKGISFGPNVTVRYLPAATMQQSSGTCSESGS